MCWLYFACKIASMTSDQTDYRYTEAIVSVSNFNSIKSSSYSKMLEVNPHLLLTRAHFMRKRKPRTAELSKANYLVLLCSRIRYSRIVPVSYKKDSTHPRYPHSSFNTCFVEDSQLKCFSQIQQNSRQKRLWKVSQS